MATQTATQIVAAWEGAKTALLPAVVSDLQVNADYIRHRIGVLKLDWTSENILAVVLTLNAEGKILWDIQPTAPKQKTLAELGAEMDRKQREKRFASTHQKSHIEAGEAGRLQHLVEAAAKELASLKSQITREIDGHIVGHHSGGTNWTRTDSERGTLRGVAGKYNDLTTVEAAKGVLLAVRIAKNKLGR